MKIRYRGMTIEAVPGELPTDGDMLVAQLDKLFRAAEETTAASIAKMHRDLQFSAMAAQQRRGMELYGNSKLGMGLQLGGLTSRFLS